VPVFDPQHRNNQKVKEWIAELQAKVEVEAKTVNRVAAITRDTVVEMHLKEA
jgi:hypothetical protein